MKTIVELEAARSACIRIMNYNMGMQIDSAKWQKRLSIIDKAINELMEKEYPV